MRNVYQQILAAKYPDLEDEDLQSIYIVRRLLVRVADDRYVDYQRLRNQTMILSHLISRADFVDAVLWKRKTPDNGRVAVALADLFWEKDSK